MRIIAVIPTGPGSHLIHDASREVDALRRRGHEVEIFELQSRKHPKIMLRDLMRLRRLTRKFSADIVHSHYGGMTALLSIIATYTQAAVIVTFRGSDLNPVPSDRSLRVIMNHLLSRLTACFARGVVCVSAGLRDRLWRRSRSWARVIPVGVPTNEFFPIARDMARKAIGWPLETPTVLFNAGSEPAIKRQDLAEATINLARREMSDLQFVVLDGTVPSDKVALMMNAADCLIVTSDFEGSPKIVQEAMACGLPVVTVPVGDVRERLALVTHSSIVPRDSKRLAAAVLEVIATKPRTNGPGIAQSELSLEKIAVSIEAVYVDALQRMKGQRGRTIPARPR